MASNDASHDDLTPRDVLISVVPPVSDTGPSSFRVPVSTVAIIPAGYQSSRLAGKALAAIGGRTMIEHVYRRAAAAASVMRVIVATDDRRILETVQGFGGEAVMTALSHQSGTDRLAEVAAKLDCDLVVNVQGDEPLLAPETIDAAVAPFVADPALQMSTLRRRITDPAELAEALEQLRALEHGIRIRAIETTHETIGVDMREDLERVRVLLAHPIAT